MKPLYRRRSGLVTKSAAASAVAAVCTPIRPIQFLTNRRRGRKSREGGHSYRAPNLQIRIDLSRSMTSSKWVKGEVFGNERNYIVQYPRSLKTGTHNFLCQEVCCFVHAPNTKSRPCQTTFNCPWHHEYGHPSRRMSCIRISQKQKAIGTSLVLNRFQFGLGKLALVLI